MIRAVHLLKYSSFNSPRNVVFFFFYKLNNPSYSLCLSQQWNAGGEIEWKDWWSSPTYLDISCCNYMSQIMERSQISWTYTLDNQDNYAPIGMTLIPDLPPQTRCLNHKRGGERLVVAWLWNEAQKRVFSWCLCFFKSGCFCSSFGKRVYKFWNVQSARAYCAECCAYEAGGRAAYIELQFVPMRIVFLPSKYATDIRIVQCPWT